MTTRVRIPSLLFLAGIALPAAGQVGAMTSYLVAPSDPVAGEKLFVTTSICQGSSPTFYRDRPSFEVRPGSVHLKADIVFGGFAVPSCVRIRVLSPPVPAGDHDALFSYTDAGPPMGSTIGPAVLARLSVRPRPADIAPLHRRLSGNWFDPAAPGTGVNIIQGVSGALLAAWLTHPPREYFDRGLVDDYNLSALGGWYVMSEGLWIAPNVFRGPLFQTRGSSAESPWDPAKLLVEPVGIAEFTFVSDRELRFKVTVTHQTSGQITQTQTLRRFSF